MNYYIECWKKYAVFSGRARRKEYWMFVLFNILAAFAFTFLLCIVGIMFRTPGLASISGLYSLAALLPGLGVTVRRLHDTGRSGWWLLFAIVPILGVIVLFVFMCLDSEPDDNQYGLYPKY